MSILSTIKTVAKKVGTGIVNSLKSVVSSPIYTGIGYTPAKKTTPVQEFRVGENMPASKIPTAYEKLGIAPKQSTSPAGTPGGYSFVTPQTNKYGTSNPLATGLTATSGSSLISPVSTLTSTKKTSGGSGKSSSTIVVPTLPESEIPTNLSKINSSSSPSLPSSTSYSSPQGLATESKSTVAGIDARTNADALELANLEETNRKLAEVQAKGKSESLFLDKMFGKKTTKQEELAQAQEELGINKRKQLKERQADIASYNAMANELGQLEAARNAQILQTNDIMGSRNFANNMVAKIERNSAPAIYSLNAKMSAQAALMQAKEENWAEADKLAAQAVEYAMADRKDELDMMAEYRQLNNDLFDSTSKIYSDAFDKKYALLLEQYKQQEADKTEMMQLALKYGINVDPKKDNLETVTNRIIKSGGTISLESSKVGGLTPNQINQTVNSIASQFDNEAIVKNFNTAQEGYQTIKSIGVNTKSPADDIAFIYSFAKIMDPNSVVREGEYNTVQKYAQTWADNFNFKAQRIFSNTNFLSSDAKQKMLNALKPKIQTLSNQYSNVQNEYQRQIDAAYTGQSRQITNYAQAFDTSLQEQSKEDIFDSIVQPKGNYFTNLWNSIIGQ